MIASRPPVVGTGTPSASLAAAIAKRAAAVRRMGTYIGFWEWLMYSAMRGRPVELLFGSFVAHLHDFFPPPTPPPMGRSVRVAAVRLTDKGEALAETIPYPIGKKASASAGGALPRVNHYLIGKKASASAGDAGDHVPEMAGGHGPKTSGGHGPQSLGGPKPPKRKQCAVRAASLAGWRLLQTQACGDCGIDVMAYHDGHVRVPSSWRKIREELANFMTGVKDDVGWQCLYKACQEAEPSSSTGASTTGASSTVASSSAASSSAGPFVGGLALEATGLPHAVLGAPAVVAAGLSELARPSLPVGATGLPMSCGQGPLSPASPQAVATSLPAVVATGPSASGGHVPPPLPPPPLPPPPLPHPEEPAPGVVDAVGPKAFVAWIQSLPRKRLDEVTSGLAAFLEAEDQWRAEQKAHVAGARSLPKGRFRLAQLLNYKRAVGLRFLSWRAAAGQESKSVLKDFLRSFRDYKGKLPPKNDRVWLRSCIKLAKDADAEANLLAKKGRGGKRPTMAKARTPDAFLRRRRGGQGRRFKCPVVREMLFDWFVDMRASVAGILTPHFVMAKAKQLAAAALEHMRQTGVYAPLPKINRGWLLRWKRDYGVVLRRPNMRYKCSKPLLIQRLRAMWVNNIKVRRLFQHFCGHDASACIWGIDEKPLHMNEGGSKNVKTLELCGAPSVRLKENHAATRERVSVMTCVTSDETVATQPSKIPIEVLFKAKSARRTAKLVVPKGVSVSIAWAIKGSYREEHILAYLDRWLRPWTEERKAALDYKILYLDVARSHVGDRVVDFCFLRGYLALFHYGCTTGVGQVNDTDLHAEFERLYVEFEQAAFVQQQLYDPGNIGRTPQQLLNDVIATWRSLNHRAAATGHKRNGLSIALDGSEDHLVTRQARDFWALANMPAERLRAIAEVDAAVAMGQVRSMEDWRSLVRHPESPGVLHHEGQEFEGELGAHENVWEDEGDVSMATADDVDAEAEATADAMDAEASVRAAVGPLDAEADVVKAVSAAQRLTALRRLRAAAVVARVPAAANAVVSQISLLERGLTGMTKKDREANALLRRHLEETRAQELAKLQKHREEAAKAKRRNAFTKRLRAAIAKRKEALKKARADVKAREAKVPKMFTLEDVGPEGAKGDKARRECLDRLLAAAPPLAVEDSVRWPRIRDSYIRDHMIKWGKVGGEEFLKQVNAVLTKLKAHSAASAVAGASAPSTGGGVATASGKLEATASAKLRHSAPSAFLDFYRKLEKMEQKPTVYAML